MANFKPYEGDVIPLEDTNYKPYDGEIIPIQDESEVTYNSNLADPVVRESVGVPEDKEDIRYIPGIPTGNTEPSVNDYTRQVKNDDGSWQDTRTIKDQYKLALLAQKLGEELPTPGSQMYDGVEGDQKQALYDLYKNDPNSKMTPTGLSYKGKQVPGPTQSVIDDVPVIGSVNKAIDRIGFGVANSATQMAQDLGITTAAVVDETADLFGGNTQYAKNLDDWLADYNPQGVVDNMIAEGTKGAIAATIASKMGNPNKKVRMMQDGTPVGKVGGALLKGEAIYAAGSNESSELGFGKWINDSVGLNKAAKLLGHEGDNDYSSKALESKVNIFAEGLVASGVMEGVMRGAIATGRFGKSTLYDPLVTFFSDDALKKKVVRDMMNDLANLPDKATPEQIMAAKKKIIDYANDPENRSELIELGIKNLEKVEIPNTTLQTIEKGANNAEDKVSAERAFNTETKTQKLDLPETKTKLAAQEDILNRTIGDVENKGFEGEQARDAGKDLMVKNADLEKDRVLGEYDKRASDLSGVLKGDEKLGKIADEVEQNTVQGKSYSQGKAGQIVDVLEDDERALAKQEDEKWKAFTSAAKDIPMNPDFNKVYKEAEQYLPAKQKGLVKDSKAAEMSDFEKSLQNDPEAFEMYKNLKGNTSIPKQEGEGASYGEVTSAITKTNLKRLINLAERAKGPGSDEFNALSNLYQNLYKDQENFIRELNPEVGALADEARRFSRDEYQTYYAQGTGHPLGTIREKSDELVKPYDDFEQAGIAAKSAFRKKAVGLVEQTFKDNGRELAPVVIQRLDANGQKDLASEFIFGSAVEKLVNKLRTKGGSLDSQDQLEVKDLFNSLQQVASSLSPEDAARVDGLMKSFEAKKTDLKNLMPELVKAADRAKFVEERVKGQALKEFFMKIPDEFYNNSLKPTDRTATQIFDDIIKGPNPEETIARLKEIASRQPDAPILDKALKSAWYRNFRSNLFNRERLNTNVIDEMKYGEDKILNVGRQLFGDDDPVFNATIDIANVIGGNKLKREVLANKKTEMLNPANIKMGASVAANQIITLSLGVLNRLSQRARTGTSILMNRADPRDTYVQFIDEINSNPELFTNLAKQVMQDETYLTTPGMTDALLKFISKSAYNWGDNDEDARTAIMEEQQRLKRGEPEGIIDETEKAFGLKK